MPAEPVLVTGANGHLGRALCAALAGRHPVRALVRSERAAAMLRELPVPAQPEIRVVDPADPSALATAAAGYGAWVHLVGILKESRTARYRDAHEELAERVAQAAGKAGVPRLVYLSILGARPDADNACLASKGRAEAILLASSVPTTVLRVPMVLGPEELAAAALRGQALARLTFLVRGGATLEQPIDTRDVVAAILAAAEDRSGASVALDLAGPESLTHRALVGRVAALFGRRPRVVPLPWGVAAALAGIFERLLAAPPLTRAMLGVLEHDDHIDPRPAAERLGLALRPLDETLRFSFPDAQERR